MLEIVHSAMKRTAAVVAVLALLATGCGADDSALSRTQVEGRVAAQIGDRQDIPATAACVERSEKNSYRCEVTADSVISEYDVRVSEDGVRIALDER